VPSENVSLMSILKELVPKSMTAVLIITLFLD